MRNNLSIAHYFLTHSEQTELSMLKDKSLLSKFDIVNFILVFDVEYLLFLRVDFSAKLSSVEITPIELFELRLGRTFQSSCTLKTF